MPIRTDIMTGTIELPTEELRKQYRHLSFGQSSSQNDMHSFPEQGLVTQEDEQVQLAQRTFSQSTSRETHVLDEIVSSTNSWSVALSKTRMLSRWLELSGENSLTLAYEQGSVNRDL